MDVEALRVKVRGLAEDALAKRWGNRLISRISWRDQGAARIRDSLREHGVDPRDREVTDGFFLGVWWATRETSRLLREARKDAQVLKAITLTAHLADLCYIALDLCEEAERQAAEDGGLLPEE